MDIFISWSGERSQRVAVLLRTFFRRVLQETQPWMSEEDIRSGTRWSEEIGGRLNQASFAVVVLTRDNVERPWLNFEAGAVSKSIANADVRVVPLLVDLESPAEVRGPLTQFQSRPCNQEGLTRILRDVNELLQRPLPPDDLEEQIDLLFPRFDQDLQQVMRDTQQAAARADAPPPRRERDLLEELLTRVRDLQRTSDRVLPDSEGPLTEARAGVLMRDLALALFGIQTEVRASSSLIAVLAEGDLSRSQRENLNILGRVLFANRKISVFTRVVGPSPEFAE